MRERRRTRFGVIYDADRLPVLTFVVQVPVAWGLSDSDLTFQTGFLALWAQSKIPFPPYLFPDVPQLILAQTVELTLPRDRSVAGT